MPESFVKQVFNILKSACKVGGYAVISLDEVCDALDRSVSQEELDSAVGSLIKEGGISLRFSEGGEYCYTVLSDVIFEPDEVKPVDNARNTGFVAYFALVMLASFAGGLIGGLIAGAFF